jgi:hypothetical protein
MTEDNKNLTGGRQRGIPTDGPAAGDNGQMSRPGAAESQPEASYSQPQATSDQRQEPYGQSQAASGQQAPYGQQQRPVYRQPQLPVKQPLVFSSADKWLLAGALLLGIVFVWLFYDKYIGISVPLFIIAFYSLLFAYTKPVLKREAGFGWFLSIPVLLLSLTFFFFRNEVLMVLNVLVLPPIILLQTMLVTGVNTYKWFSPGILLDLIMGMFARCLSHIAKPFGIISSMVRNRKGAGSKKSVASRVFIGILISVPVLLVLLLLLSSADMVFGKMVEKLPEFLDSLNFGELISRMIIALFIFFISFSYLWSLGHGEKILEDSNGTGLVSARSPEEKRRWDPVILITVTALVDILYIFFVIIQFTYLFGRFGLPEGLTYSEYARNGFSELVFVSLLNMGMLAVTLTCTKRMNSLGDKVFRLLNSVMICCTFVMLCSAFYRMSLYEAAYGFTFLRIMTQAFMIFLFVLFIITMARVWNDRIPLLKSYIASAVIAFTVINYINVDAMIAQKNVARYQETGKIDIYYFDTLSDAVVKELRMLSEDKDPEIASNAKKMIDIRKMRLEGRTDWQSFNLTDHLARKEILK